MPFTRRQFLLASAGASTLSLTGCERLPWEAAPSISVNRPGMVAGHLLRDQRALPKPSETLECEVAIIGSGIAGLTAAWKLIKEGKTHLLLLNGPEPDGNASGGRFGQTADTGYPTGAHYLPLPSMESAHVREMLADLGIITEGAFTEKPTFDERALIHAMEERLYENGAWSEGLLHPEDEDSRRFLALISSLQTAKGEDARKLFAIPVVLSSTDEKWRALDAQTFSQWLAQNHYTSPRLLWYLDYCCRDDYGMGIDKVSAWAGLHYFAARAGQARNAEHGTHLTWPDGLQTLARKLRDHTGLTLGQPNTKNNARQLDGFAARIHETDTGVEVLVIQSSEDGTPRTLLIKAQSAICAMPLHMAKYIVQGMDKLGFNAAEHMPEHAPWMIANYRFTRFPKEAPGAELAWDNVPFGTRNLGYVVSTHQLFRVAKPEKTVFTTYCTLHEKPPIATRTWLLNATPEELSERAGKDLRQVYGWRYQRHVEHIDITLRAHAMASPLPGYLSNAGLIALRNAKGKLKFAHSDLSGYSVFEEAAWWGYQAALSILK